MGGLDRVAARVADVRAEVGAERVLLLDAGDTLGDTLVAAQTEGRALIETMNAMRYDAMVIGNHEPDFTADALKARIGEAGFPVLAANIVGRDGRLFARPYVLKDVGGVRVGILGIAYPNTPLTTAKRNVEGLRFLQAVETARKYVPRMRREGARIVIALTHLGLGADKALAERRRGHRRDRGRSQPQSHERVAAGAATRSSCRQARTVPTWDGSISSSTVGVSSRIARTSFP